MTPRRLLVLAGASAASCVAAGLSYVFVSPTELPVATLVLFGILGGAGLVGAGVWQNATASPERFPLATLALVGVAYTAASALGIVGAGIARAARLEPTGLPQTLHALGGALGILLSVATLMILKRSWLSARRESAPHEGITDGSASA